MGNLEPVLRILGGCKHVCSVLRMKGLAACCCTWWELGKNRRASSVVLLQLLGVGGSGCLNVTFYNCIHLHIQGCSLGKFCTSLLTNLFVSLFVVRS